MGPNPTAAPGRPDAVETLLDTALVTEATRTALRARLAWSRPPKPMCFDAAGFATLEAICNLLIPQPHGRRVDLAARLDERLANGPGDGWRYAELPPDRMAITRGVQGVDETARGRFGAAFNSLAARDQAAVLGAVQDGSACGPTWDTLPPKLFFEELLAMAAELYYAHPFAQDAIGYLGMADAEGFAAVGLNQREPFEIPAADAAP